MNQNMRPSKLVGDITSHDRHPFSFLSCCIHLQHQSFPYPQNICVKLVGLVSVISITIVNMWTAFDEDMCVFSSDGGI